MPIDHTTYKENEISHNILIRLRQIGENLYKD